MRWFPLFSVLLLISAGLAGCGADQSTQPEEVPGSIVDGSAPEVQALGNPGVLPPNSRAFGKSYAEWSVDWWQWMASAPLSENPGLDETGEFVDWGQTGHVWFLAPNFGGYDVREAVIPTGKALFLPIIGFETSEREGFGSTEEELRSAAAEVMSLVENLQFEIDGREVLNIAERYQFQSAELFSLTVPDDNVFDLWGVPTDAGTYYPSAADGFYLMLAPLNVGQHTLHLHGEIPEFDYVTDVTFHLTVAP